MLFIVLGLIALPFILLILYYKYQFTHWKKKNVPEFNKPPTIPWGHIPSAFSTESRNMGIHVEEYYNYFKKIGSKYGGIYFMLRPVFIPVDLDIVKQVMATNFDHFNGKGMYYNDKDQPLSGHLFNIGGAKWKRLRMKLTPTFTSGKMKMMFSTLLECSKPLEQIVMKYAKEHTEFDIKKLSAQYTTDVIGSCAFGIDCNSFENPNSEFIIFGRKSFDATLFRLFQRTLHQSFPRFSKCLGLITMPQDVEEFFTRMVSETVRYREENQIIRKDFIQLLIELKNKENPDERLNMQDIVAQSFLFFLAGFETSSTTMTYCLLELSLHPEIQDKLRSSIISVLNKHNGEITYESLGEMKYLQQVLDETLRLHPPVPIINRGSTSDYKIPGTEASIDKDTLVFIPVLAIHKDPEIYPDPDTFDPERFSDENKQQRHPYAWLPFGEGPRACIGLRFGYMQAKVGLVILLTKFLFKLSSSTKLPLSYERGLILAPAGDISLYAEAIK